MQLQLSKSPHPKTGLNERNSSSSDFHGAKKGTIITSIPLESDDSKIRNCGFVVAENGNIGIAMHGFLSAYTQDGTLLWKRQIEENTDNVLSNILDFEYSEEFLEEIITGKSKPRYHSAPTALANGNILITTEFCINIYNPNGKQVFSQIVNLRNGLDDTGHSPTLAQDGTLILTSPMDDVFAYNISSNEYTNLGYFGHDIVQPAVFTNNTIAISGYTTGFHRVDLEGNGIWKTGLADIDSVACINMADCSAVCSTNDNITAVYDSSGTEIGRVNQNGLFSVCNGTDWVLLSYNLLSRYNCNMELLWSARIDLTVGLKTRQAIIDGNAIIHTAVESGMAGFDINGNQVYILPLQSKPLDFGIIRNGVMGALLQNEFVIFE